MSEPNDKCPTCDSPAPHLHPAVQFEGEVQECADAFHQIRTNQNPPYQHPPAPSPVPTLTRSELVKRIRAWQEDDKQGYDTAIGLLCAAADQLADVDALLRAREQALREVRDEMENWVFADEHGLEPITQWRKKLGQLLIGPEA